MMTQRPGDCTVSPMGPLDTEKGDEAMDDDADTERDNVVVVENRSSPEVDIRHSQIRFDERIPRGGVSDLSTTNTEHDYVVCPPWGVNPPSADDTVGGGGDGSMATDDDNNDADDETEMNETSPRTLILASALSAPAKFGSGRLDDRSCVPNSYFSGGIARNDVGGIVTANQKNVTTKLNTASRHGMDGSIIVQPKSSECSGRPSTMTSSDQPLECIGGSSTDDLTPSVLRALLQSSGKQVVYKTHNHTSDGPQSRSLQRQQQQPSQMAPTRHSPQRPISRPFPNPHSMSASTQETASGHKVRRRMIHSPGAGDGGEGSHRREPQPRKEETRSEIKALLMGQTYQRVPATVVVSHSDVVDLSWRGTRDDRSEAGFGGGRGSPTCKRPRMDTAQHQIVVQEHSLSPFLVQVVEMINEFNDLSYSVHRGSNYSSVEVRRKGLYGIPAVGLTPAQVVVEDRGQAHFMTVIATTGTTASVHCMDGRDRLCPSVLRPLLHKLSIRGGHVFCPGVSSESVGQTPANVTKSLVRVELGPPHKLGQRPRYQAKDCPVWYVLGPDQGWLPLNEGIQKCKSCKGLERNLKVAKRRKEHREADNGGSAAGAGSTIVVVDSNSEYVCVWGPATSPSEKDELH